MSTSAQRYLWSVFPGFAVVLVLSMLIRIATIFMLIQANNGMTFSAQLNQQANRTTTMRQDAADYAAQPTYAIASRLLSDYLAWKNTQTTLLSNIDSYEHAIQDQLLLTRGPEGSITEGVSTLLDEKDASRLDREYINLVVYVGRYNLIMNAIASVVLGDNITILSISTWTNLVFGAVVIAVFGFELVYALLPAYYELRDNLRAPPTKETPAEPEKKDEV